MEVSSTLRFEAYSPLKGTLSLRAENPAESLLLVLLQEELRGSKRIGFEYESSNKLPERKNILTLKALQLKPF